MTTKSFIRNPIMTTSPKEYVRETIVNFLMEVFRGEGADGFGFTNDPNNQGLRILATFPEELRELPCITITLTGFRFTAVTNNKFLNSAITDSIDGQFQDHSEMGQRQMYNYNATVGISITANNYEVRDQVMDKLFNIFAWENYKIADELPLREYFLDRGMAINRSDIPTAGDSEDVLDTGDIVFRDGMSLPIYGEVISPKIFSDRVTGIDMEVETTSLQPDTP